MALRAIIFDVYNTLLDVHPGPSNAEAIWQAYWAKEELPVPVPWDALEGVMQAMVSASHRQSRLAGEEHPEVNWQHLLAQVCGVGDWPDKDQQALCFLEAKLRRRCTLMPGAASFLLHCHQLGVALGICSNGQSCTETELLEAMLAEKMDVDEVFPSFRFYSYQHGFAKPSTKPFAWLEAQLAEHGVAAEEIMMIGDKPDKDIAPALARGWQTHLLVEANWPRLAAAHS
jgi:FMN phosphatase YigB (HAD superfamily)